MSAQRHQVSIPSLVVRSTLPDGTQAFLNISHLLTQSNSHFIHKRLFQGRCIFTKTSKVGIVSQIRIDCQRVRTSSHRLLAPGTYVAPRAIEDVHAVLSPPLRDQGRRRRAPWITTAIQTSCSLSRRQSSHRARRRATGRGA